MARAGAKQQISRSLRRRISEVKPRCQGFDQCLQGVIGNPLAAGAWTVAAAMALASRHVETGVTEQSAFAHQSSPASPIHQATSGQANAGKRNRVGAELEHRSKSLRSVAGAATDSLDGNTSACRAALAMVAGAAAIVLQRGSFANGVKRHRAGASRSVLTRRAESGDGKDSAAAEAALSEAEKMFQEAYQAEVERAKLLKEQLERALMKQFEGTPGMKISLEDEMAAPGGAGRTWRQAYEEARDRTASLEEQLKKAEGFSKPPPVQQTPTLETETTTQFDSTSVKKEDEDENVFDILGFQPGGKDLEVVRKLEDLIENTLEDETTTRLVVQLAALGSNGPMELKAAGAEMELPPKQTVSDVVGSDQFVVSEFVDFDRIYVLKGATAQGVEPGAALEAVTRRFQDKGYADTVEVYLQRSKEEGKSVMLVMLKEDLPQNEFPWYLALLALACLVFSGFTANATTFTLAAMPDMAAGMPIEEMAKYVAEKTVPTATVIFSTLAFQEAVRRVIAASYGVTLTPPFFIPVWPLPSVGILGTISRRLTPPPNLEAELALSLGPGIAGIAVATAALFTGLSSGVDPETAVNLNFQTLPVFFKLALKPLLGTAPVTAQPDPFQDPINLAFPANPVTIGGVVSLVIVLLNLLPIGRLDGGILARGSFDSSTAGVIGFLAFFMLLAGSFTTSEAGADLYLVFGLYCLLFQGGFEAPPRDTVTKVNDGAKVLAGVVVVAATILSLPGSFFPNA